MSITSRLMVAGEHGQGLAVLHQVDDMPHVLVKAHVQHLVGLVQDDLGHMAQVDAAVLVVVHQAAGGGHHDLTALGRRRACLSILAPPYTQATLTAGIKYVRSSMSPAICWASSRVGARITAWGTPFFRPDVLGHRDAKGAGLAGAGGSLGDHVPAFHHQRDHFFLDLAVISSKPIRSTALWMASLHCNSL